MSQVTRNAQNKQMVDTAIAAGYVARRRGSQTILPSGQRRDLLGQQVLAGQATGRNSSYVVLADNFGNLTVAGRHYYESTGLARPDAGGIDRNQALIHRNGSDYIRGANGQERKVRTLQPSGDMTLTTLGRSFFKRQVRGACCSCSRNHKGNASERRRVRSS